MTPRTWPRRLWLALGGLLVALLAAAVFTLGSLNVPLRAEQGNALLILFALSTFIAAALMVFGLILTRSLLRLWAERRAGLLGSRFKTKMVLGAMGVSLLPVVFLFFFSYALVNRTLNLWFPRPLEIAAEQSNKILEELSQGEHQRLQETAADAAKRKLPLDRVHRAFGSGVDAAWTLDSKGIVQDSAAFEPGTNSKRQQPAPSPISPRLVRTLPGGAELWQAADASYLGARAPTERGVLILARRIPGDLLARLNDVEAQTATYVQQRRNIRAYKAEILLTLLLITVLLLFAATWAALFLSKRVTVPIQALAEATQEIARGNFEHRVAVQAHDELGTLVGSFNGMTAQLDESRRKIDDFTRNLQQAFEERERRRILMEAVLENIPTGVLSLDPDGGIARANSAVIAIFGDYARQAHTLAELAGEAAAREIQQLMRKSLRMGAASGELEIPAAGRLLHAAVTVSSLGPRRANPGFVVVIDDLTELLRAQKAAAWQEVAQRIAHEIKNPLTPIQLSAQRLLRHLDRAGRAGGARSDFENLVAECARLIEQEVETLESLVNEFSQFVRFPAARLAPADLNAVVASALEVFQGRLEGIRLHTDLAPALPLVKADAELLRRVFVNLVDNAAEALEGAAIRRLSVATRVDPNGEAVEIEVSDSGHGISPEDKDKLFLPHFSTKERGTGLGLAIANRIVAEHHGTLRVEDNVPTGARFVVRFPAAEVTAAPTVAGNGAD
jgi:two-component system nitrogen regulation sensor histidine kinase NtrY